MDRPSGFYKTGQNRVYHYATAGDPSHPALLLLHGFTGSQAVWSPLADRLADSFYLVMPDLPGHGQTFSSDQRPDMALETTVQDLLRLLGDLGVSSAGILGYSMGGRLALHFPLYGASRVRFLILESTTAGIVSPAGREERRQSDNDLAQRIETLGIEWFVDYWSNIPLLSGPAATPQQTAHRLHNTAQGLARSLRAAGTGQQASLWPVLPYYAAPALIVAGERDKKFTEIAHRLHHALPDSRVEIVKEAGHTVHVENPDAFFQVVVSFLEQKAENTTQFRGE